MRLTLDIIAYIEGRRGVKGYPAVDMEGRLRKKKKRAARGWCRNNEDQFGVGQRDENRE